ncbi:MAG: nitrous oxide-stimulated promoter family protein [Chitinivibrionales bacterium]|nr:nitrous oxide-stimulated promoter family protein [Chitinivibrionales bacterium]
MKANTPRFKREAKTIRVMVGLYCRDQHGFAVQPCPECAEIISYVLGKLEKCPWGEKKPVCAQCTIHCYEKSMRARIAKVMRHSGPRMAARHPLLALSHLLNKFSPRL